MRRYFVNPWTGTRWTILYVPEIVEEGTECDGLCNYETKELFVCTGQDRFHEALTLIHEAWHTKSRSKNVGHIIRNRRLDNVIEDILKIQIALGMIKL